MKTALIFCILFSRALLLHAGPADTASVIRVNEVQVVRSRLDYYAAGQKIISLSADWMDMFRSQSLGDMLGTGAQVFIKSYGSEGALSTISMRGTGSNHTQVCWNDFPLNSVTSGDADLSLVPVQLAEGITIRPGASGSLYGSGTFGGSLNIESAAGLNVPMQIQTTAETGSFHSNYLFGKISRGYRRLGYSLAVAYKNSLNDYTFPDIYKPGAPTTTLQHNRLNAYGVYQMLTFAPKPRSRFEMGLWFQRKIKDIPEMMGSYGSSLASQTDSTLKVFGKWTRIFGNSALIVKSAVFSDYLKYTDKNNPSDVLYTVYNVINSRQYLADASFRKYAARWLSFDAGLSTQIIHARLQSFGREIDEPRYAIFMAFRFSLPHFTADFTARNEMTPGRKPRPVLGIGSKIELWRNRMFLRLNASGKYRLPTLNEKYWQPGGNPDILPEEGYTSEFGLNYIMADRSGLKLTLDVGGFSTRIMNMIEWTGSNLNWSPVNDKSVWSRGLESQFDIDLILSGARAHSSVSWNYILSTNTEVYAGAENSLGKQLRYVPVHSGQWITTVTKSAFVVGYVLSYTGKVYITEDNSGKPLDARLVSGGFLTWEKPLKQNTLQLSCRIANIFNAHYQVIASFPAPGRAVYFSLSYRFQSKPKSNR